MVSMWSETGTETKTGLFFELEMIWAIVSLGIYSIPFESSTIATIISSSGIDVMLYKEQDLRHSLKKSFVNFHQT